FDEIRVGGFFLQCARRGRLPDTTHTGKISEHARSLDRDGICCCICRRSSAATALSRTYLIQLHAQHMFNQGEKYMHPTNKAARIAGAAYPTMVLTGPFSLIYVLHKLIDRGNPSAIAYNTLSHETMFRLSIMS